MPNHDMYLEAETTHLLNPVNITRISLEHNDDSIVCVDRIGCTVHYLITCVPWDRRYDPGF